jgi:hypothetical protein
MKRKAANVDPRVRDILKSLVNAPNPLHKPGSTARRERVTGVAQAAAISDNWTSEYIGRVTRSERRIRCPGGPQRCVTEVNLSGGMSAKFLRPRDRVWK